MRITNLIIKLIKRIPGSRRVYQALLAANNRDNNTQQLMCNEVIKQELNKIEVKINETTSQDELFEKLRYLGLNNFAMLLLSMPNPSYPRMSKVLPRMASEEVQKKWTGASGITLLTQTLNFVRSVSYNFCKFTGESLDNKSILDFGCGYGRIARLMYFFTHPNNFFGVDPWDKSISICHEDGLTKNFLLSDWLPSELPTGENKFSLIYSFSVFTHLSEKATRIALSTLLRHLSLNGILVITIRPIEYWYAHKDNFTSMDEQQLEQQLEKHNRDGFSFLPHNRPAVDGDITYGDTTMSLDWIKNQFPSLQILGIDASINDPLQIYLFIRNAGFPPLPSNDI
jgi:SAM-dependent methyltransferase